MSVKNCPSCGAPATANSTECRYCGEPLPAAESPQGESPQQPASEASPPPIRPQEPTVYMHAAPYAATKSKTLAGVLAILLGGLGIHKFYLGKIFQGILYALFCWTYIPFIVGFVEGVIYMCISDERFQYRYAKRW